MLHGIPVSKAVVTAGPGVCFSTNIHHVLVYSAGTVVGMFPQKIYEEQSEDEEVS